MSSFPEPPSEHASTPSKKQKLDIGKRRIDFQLAEHLELEDANEDQDELLTQVLDADDIKPNSQSAWQPFATELIWPKCASISTNWPEVFKVCLEWSPLNKHDELYIPLLEQVPVLPPNVAIFLDQVQNRRLMFHAVAMGDSPDDCELLPILCKVPESTPSRMNIDLFPSAAPPSIESLESKKKHQKGNDPSNKQQPPSMEEVCSNPALYLALRLGITLRYRATILRARFHIKKEDAKLLRTQNLWKAFLVNEQWIINYIAEKYITDCLVDRPLLGPIRAICHLLGLKNSYSQASGIAIKRLQSYPRTKEDIAKLGLKSKAKTIGASTVNRAAYYALRCWTGTTVKIHRGHRARLVDFENCWFLP